MESHEKKIEELSTLSTTVEQSHDDQCFRIKIEEQAEEIKGLKKQVSVLKRLNTNLEKKFLSSTSIDSKAKIVRSTKTIKTESTSCDEDDDLGVEDDEVRPTNRKHLSTKKSKRDDVEEQQKQYQPKKLKPKRKVPSSDDDEEFQIAENSSRSHHYPTSSSMLKKQVARTTEFLDDDQEDHEEYRKSGRTCGRGSFSSSLLNPPKLQRQDEYYDDGVAGGYQQGGHNHSHDRLIQAQSQSHQKQVQHKINYTYYPQQDHHHLQQEEYRKVSGERDPAFYQQHNSRRQVLQEDDVEAFSSNSSGRGKQFQPKPMQALQYDEDEVYYEHPPRVSNSSNRHQPQVVSGRYQPQLVPGRYQPQVVPGRYQPQVVHDEQQHYSYQQQLHRPPSIPQSRSFKSNEETMYSTGIAARGHHPHHYIG